MSDAEDYDAIVIGSGQSGGPLAGALGKAGWKTAIVEREHVGGTCINEGCTPTKTMIASARVAYLARRAADYGVETGPVTVDMERVRQRKRDVVERFRSSRQKRIESEENVDLIMGEASFESQSVVAVRLTDGSTRRLKAAKIFVDTGARPAMPRVPGLDEVSALDSTSVMELSEVPEHLLSVGGSYVGLEFAQLFRRLGSRVTVIEQAPTFLGREDEDVADEMAKILREDGIELLIGTRVLRVEKGADGRVRMVTGTPEGERTLEGSHLLVAAGRVPNTDRLNVAAAGLETDDRGFLKVNERLETNVPGIYAMGDVTGEPAFTHISYDDFRILKANLLEGGNATTTGRATNYVVFTDPQLGRIGLTEKQARSQGHKVRVAKMPMSHVARAIEVDEPRGLMKVVVEADTGQILGAAVLGLEGGELMAMLEIAMLGKLPYTVLRDAVFAHPSLSEALNNLFTSME